MKSKYGNFMITDFIYDPETYFKVTSGLNQNDGYLNFYIYFVLKYNINSQCKQI